VIGIKIVIISIGLCLSFIVGNAYCADPIDTFQNGVNAARQGNYADAVNAFRAAAEQGLDTPALHYNLGVAYYKLAKYPEAQEQFTLLAQTPAYASLAYYNLGLVALKMGKEGNAKQWFRRCYNTTGDAKLKTLSTTALERLGAPIEPLVVIDIAEAKDKKRWLGLLSATIGYDDNVSLINEDIIGLTPAQRLSDQYFEILATTSTMLTGDRDNGVRFAASADYLAYFDYSDYDFNQVHVALSKETQVSRWDTRLGAGYDRTQFAGEDFQQLYGLEVRGDYHIDPARTLGLRYRYSKIEDLSPSGVYDYLQGERHQGRIRLYHQVGHARLKYSYTYEWNDRKDLRTQVNQTQVYRSYSPVRHTVRLNLAYQAAENWVTDFDVQYRNSVYRQLDDPVRTTDGERREDHRYRLGATLRYIITRDVELFADYNYTDNDSNLVSSRYDRTLVNFGVNWFY
jgi:tetratricopeptide (TPR) repeat protein